MADAPHELHLKYSATSCFRWEQHVAAVGSELGHIALTTATGRLVAFFYVGHVMFTTVPLLLFPPGSLAITTWLYVAANLCRAAWCGHGLIS